MNDSVEYIRNEMEKLSARREKDTHNAFVDRLREADRRGDDLWTLADAAFTPEELAETHARDRRLRLYLKLDIATFVGSVIWNGLPASDNLETITGGGNQILPLLPVCLAILSFFGFFGFFFLLRSNGQEFAREFRHRLDTRKEEK